MAVSARSLAAALRSVVGSERVIDDPNALERTAVDGLLPRWIVRPASDADIAAVLAVASAETLAVVPRGSASTLALGFPPERLDIVLDMTALDRIVDWNPDDLTATVEAGVTASSLAKHLAARRQFLPLDVPGGGVRTLGGLTATAATAPLRLRYGGIRDLLLGVRFVQADGVVTWGGARVVKSVSGYDVPKLMVGALGTLGVLCGLTFRLHPVPDVSRTSILSFATVEAAHAFVAALVDSSVQASRAEWLNRRALVHMAAPDAPAALAVSIASVAAAVAEQGEIVATLARRHDGAVAETSDAWWDRYGARLDGASVVLRVATLPDRLATAIRAIEAALPSAAVTGSAAIGALDVSVTPAPDLPRALAAIRTALGEHGGHAIVTRAPREARAAIDPWGPVDADAFALMQRLRQEFDAARVLNPGRFVGRL